MMTESVQWHFYLQPPVYLPPRLTQFLIPPEYTFWKNQNKKKTFKNPADSVILLYNKIHQLTDTFSKSKEGMCFLLLRKWCRISLCGDWKALSNL